MRIIQVLALLFGLAALLVAARSPVEALVRRLYDLYLAGSGPDRCPGDMVALSPEPGEAVGEWSEAEASAALRLLGEFGARRVALADPRFGRASARDRLEALRSELPGIADREFGTIEGNVRGLFEALRAGTLPPKQLGKSVELLAGSIRASGERLKGAVSGGGEAGGASRPAEADSPPIAEAGAFFGSRPDPDGVLRGLVLVEEQEGHPVPSWELASLMDYLGSPALEKQAGRLILRGCTMPGGASKDLALPVDGDGRFRIGWPRQASAPRTLPISEIRSAIRDEAKLVAGIEVLEERGALGSGGAVLLSRYRRAELLRSELTSGAASAADWREAREGFFSAALARLRAAEAESKNEGAEQTQADTPPAKLETPPTQADAPPAQAGAQPAPAQAAVGAEVQALRAECLELAASLDSRRKVLSEALKGAFVFFDPSGAGEGFATVRGSRSDRTEAALVLAAAVLAGRYPLAGPAAFGIALALLLALAALSLTAVLVARGRSEGKEGGGLLKRASVRRSAGSAGSAAEPTSASAQERGQERQRP